MKELIVQMKNSVSQFEKTNTLLASSINAQNSLTSSIKDLINKKYK